MVVSRPETGAWGPGVKEEAERLFERARGLNLEARSGWVEDACRGDTRLRDELLALLVEADAAEEFFQLFGDAVRWTRFPIQEAEDRADSRTPECAPPSPRAEHRVGALVGHYRILSLIGSGGMGTVYRAHDTVLERQVALKFLPPLSTRLDDEERLLKEARSAGALQHPNICTIHEIGQTDDGRPFIAMALYEGETLKERLERSPLSLEEVVVTGIQIGRGLAAAHARGIVHRDVKPGNVILGADETVRLLDFGLAQAMEVTLTRSGITPGTVAYMSPEQARGDPLDQRSDLWSLGVVLYEMLTGLRPFRGANDRALFQAILHEDAEPFSKRRPEVPEPLARIVERLLLKDPEARYGSAAEMLAELTRSLPSELRFDKDRPLIRHQTRSIAAYELSLRGWDSLLLRSDSGVREALGYFQQAIAADSTYAAAHAGLACMYVRLGFTSDPGMPLSKLHALAEEAARKAISLDDSLAEAHYALGRVRFAAFDFASAETEIRRAIALDPTRSVYRQRLAHLHCCTGRPAEQLAEARRALETDPLDPYAHATVAEALHANRRYDEALAQLDRIATIQPPLQAFASIAGHCYAEKQMWPEAISALRPQAEAGCFHTVAQLGNTLARAGQREEANQILADLLARRERTGVGALEVAMVYMGLGDFDQTLAWLDKAIDDRSMCAIMGSTFEDLHGDPRFERLRRRLGLQKQ